MHTETINNCILYSLLIVILILAWYSYTQSRIIAVQDSTCDIRKLGRFDKKLRDEITCSLPHLNTTNRQTLSEKNLTGHDPEYQVMLCHAAGKTLTNRLAGVTEGMSMDELATVSDEDIESILLRSAIGVDGPQLPGMETPHTEFEDNAIARQDVKPQEIYGELEDEDAEEEQGEGGVDDEDDLIVTDMQQQDEEYQEIYGEQGLLPENADILSETNR